MQIDANVPLDEKLKEIKVGSISQASGLFKTEKIADVKLGNLRLADDVIAQIKQAFAEEGYIQFRDELVPPNQPPVMTGKHWYERFEKELSGLRFYGDSESAIKGAIKLAAKKAAGL